MSGNRGLWLKSKCLNREEFVVVGWTDSGGSRSHFGALLLGYHTEDGRLHYAGRAGTGFNERELARLAGGLKPLETPRMPLDNGQSTAQLPLIKRKKRLERLFNMEIQGLRCSEHVFTDGPRSREYACKLELEGIIPKRIDPPYAPNDRGLWVKSKCLNREEFVV